MTKNQVGPRWIWGLSVLFFIALGLVWLLTMESWPEDSPSSRSSRKETSARGLSTPSLDMDVERSEITYLGRAPSKNKQEPKNLPPQKLTIRGTLLDLRGHPVRCHSGAPIVLRKKKEGSGSQIVRTTAIDENGHFLLKDIPNAFYELWLEGLPKEMTLLHPVRRDPGAARAGIYCARYIDARTTRQFDIPLVAALGGTIRGYVLGPSREPVSGVHVRVQGLDRGERNTYFDTSTRTDGMYELTHVTPGDYRIVCSPGANTPPLYHECAPPIPLDTHVAEGSTADVPIVYFQEGTQTVVGAVINQDGKPIVDMEILCYLKSAQGSLAPHNWSSALARSWTDANGRFDLARLPRARVSLQIGPEDFLPSRPLGKNRLRAIVPLIDIDLAKTGGVCDVGTHEAQESRPFFYRAKVTLDKEWAKIKGNSYNSIKVRTEPASKHAHYSKRLEIDTDGTLEWGCECPHPPLHLILTSKDKQTVSIAITPEANETVEEDIRFPGH